MNDATQHAFAFAMDDAHVDDSVLAAGVQIVAYYVPRVAGTELMQVQDAVDGNLDDVLRIMISGATIAAHTPPSAFNRCATSSTSCHTRSRLPLQILAISSSE